MLRLFSYKMTHDSGFAPNPFWGELTIATCKPLIRLYKNRGDWIAGFTSGELCGDPVGGEKLVYLMKVEERVPIADYYSSPRYRNKIPDATHPLRVRQVGDNIYEPSAPGVFEQVANENHSCGDAEHDLSGEFVLTSTEFVYFGRSAIAIPEEIRPSLPAGQHPDGYRTHDENLALEFIKTLIHTGVWGIGGST